MDLAEFWENLVDGRDGFADLDDEDLLRRGERPEYLAHPQYVRRRPVLPAADEFDAGCFSMTPREAETCDPQIRLLLEVAHSALENAGYDPARYPGAIGVFAGGKVSPYFADHLMATPSLVRAVGFLSLEIGNAPDYLATTVAHRLGLRGASMTLQTACSTGLTAVHVACRALQAGDCDMALAGATNIEMPLNYGCLSQEDGIIAPDGVPRPFAADARGTNFGSGAGVVVLKRLADALADRDTIAAVVLGSALNNDGDRKPGYTAPSAMGQADCTVEAIRRARVEPNGISFVEAHCTGTAVGDPVEVAGLASAFARASTGAPPPAGSCWIGSVKSNVGHLGPAAGIVGMVKAILALQHEQIPPSINVSRVNPKLNLAETPFRLATEGQAWPRTPGRPRRAGVNSLGIGGTNAHVVLQEAPDRSDPDAGEERPARDTELLVWSGADGPTVEAYRDRLADHFASLDRETFRDAAYTLRVGRAQHRHREAAVAPDPATAGRRLRSGEAVIRADGVTRQVMFCFPGQGAQHPGMCHRLYQTEPAFQRHCDEAFETMAPLAGVDLRELWRTATDPVALNDTAVAQPLLFAVEYALARTLRDWGLHPTQVFGHSVGELVAATEAGVFEPAAGMRAVVARASLMGRMTGGGMLAVAADAERVVGHLDGEVSLAVVNDARQCVLSGPEAALADIAERLLAGGIQSRPLRVSHAFHSPAMAPAAEQFEAVLKTLTLHPPRITLVSSATGAPVTAEQATDPSFWARQLVDPVYFARAARTVAAAGPAFLLEVGPGRTLTTLLRGNPQVRAAQSVALPTQPPAGSSGDKYAGTLDETLGRLWVEGQPVDLVSRDAGSRAHRVPVPGYPYRRRRFWVERPPDREPLRDTAGIPAVSERSELATGAVTRTPVAAADWSLVTVDWVRADNGRPPVVDQQVDRGIAALALPMLGGLAAAVRTAFQRAGYRAVLATAGHGSDRPIGMALDPGSRADWDDLLTRAQERGELTTVAYAGLLDSPQSVELSTVDAQLDTGYFALLECVRAVARAQRRQASPVTVLVLARWSVDVTGAEPVNPLTAMVHGLARTVEQEHPGIRCLVVDVGPETPVDALGGALDTLAGADPPPVVALRGTAAWFPVLCQLPGDRRAVPPRRMRPGGVYLVTGGLGGIGLVVAKTLADTGLGPRIALLGRSGPPAPGTEEASALSEIEDAGAEVMIVSADVADQAAVTEAINQVEQRFGQVHGVIHGAGVPGGGLLERRGRDEAARVFAAKVRGTLVLDECFADRPELDFLLLFSSEASLTGMYGSADYAAANSFLNAYRGRPGRPNRWTAAVAWPGWSEVGMLATAPVTVEDLRGRPAPAERADAAAPDESPGPLEYRRLFHASEDWELDEHRFAGTPLLPATSVVELVLSAARSLGIVPAGPAPTELRDLVFEAPVGGAAPVDVAVVFTPAADTYTFRVWSRPSGAERPWRRHATGQMAASAQRPEAADPARLRLRFAATDPADAADPRGAVSYGPRWRSITRLWTAGRDRLAELVLPPQYRPDLAAHPAHPALLHWARPAPPAPANGAQPYYQPSSYGRVVFFAPLPHHVLVHTRAAAAGTGEHVVDADVYHPATGALLLSIRGYTVRAVPPEDFARRLRGHPAPSPHRRDAGEAPARLRPSDGAAAFLELLNGAWPPLVWVLPPGVTPAVRGVPRVGVGQPTIPPPAPAPAPPTPPPTAEPATELVPALRALWADAFGADVGIDDDFVEMGGNSLMSVQLSTRIRERLGVQLSAAELFHASTIRRVADALARMAGLSPPDGT